VHPLIKASSECIDYVITHELCHLKEHDYNRRFYKLLDQLIPDWPSVKGSLDGSAGILLNY